jgi:hypothetical protein
MNISNYDKNKRDELLGKMTKNLVKINHIMKLDMANSLLEEILNNFSKEENENITNKYEIKKKELEELNVEIENMFRNEISTLSNKIDALLVTKINFITKITVDYINKIHEQTNISYRKLNRLNKRRKLIDVLIFLNIVITPVLLIVIIYLLI